MHLWNFAPGKEGLRTVVSSGFFGCVDTTNYVPLKIKGPLAGFKVINKPCQTGNVVFLKDNSIPQNGVALVKWEWNFGDGKTEARTTGDEFSHTYFWAGGYIVSLKVTDAGGCTSFYQQYVEAQNNSLKASFTASATTVSPGTTVQFTNTSITSEPGNTTFRWILDNGSESSLEIVSRLYSQPGVYTIKLIATNALRGCADTAVQTITVKHVNAAFTFNQGYLNDAKCPPVQVQFTNTSANIT
jgi:PKD repeat protein